MVLTLVNGRRMKCLEDGGRYIRLLFCIFDAMLEADVEAKC